MRLEPLVSLAVAVQSAPGTFALLLGSGTSRAAQIPTGWDVVTDLARRIALITDGSDPADPIAWLREHSGDDPDYSSLLEAIAPTAADRRNLLAAYFEPSDEEREQGIKVPTRGHRAIAELVAAGFVRVIVTTNFDRLLETALRDAGVEPIVIDSSAAAAGATPLTHSRCTLIKVHGDYLDPNLKNTVAELSSYEPAMERLLDRVFDEYGLVVCGWSGDWDLALRNAILRNTTRRYGTYWAHRGKLGEGARQLIAHRDAVEVPIGDADTFFESLLGKVTALEESRHHPLSTDLAIAELKRYLPDPAHRIRLHDLVFGEVARVMQIPTPANMHSPHPDTQNIGQRMHEYESAASILMALLATTSYFADRPEHDALIVEAVRRLAGRRKNFDGYTVWIELELYPALQAVYAIGLGALAAGRPEPLARALALPVPHPNGPAPIAVAAASWRVLEPKICNELVAPGERRKTPTSDYLHEVLMEPLKPVIPSDAEYSDTFDQLEYLLGIVCTAEHGGGPIGRFVWRRRSESTIAPAERFEQFRDALAAAGIAGGDPDTLDEARKTYEQQVRSSGLRF